MDNARGVMSQAEYARHRGTSRQYIGKLGKEGVLVMRNGKVDVAATDANSTCASRRSMAPAKTP
jgi:hypothetical protein